MKSPITMERLSLFWKIAFPVLTLLTALWALSIGRMEISPQEILYSAWAHLSGQEGLNPQLEVVLWNMRVTRILLALFVGAGLSAAGCTFQNLFANPLATPDTLGVASGAAFGAALGILWGMNFMGVQLLSLLCGICAVALTAFAGNVKQGLGLNSIVLAGIMIGSLFASLISLVKFVADTENQLPAITYWLMGSLDGANYRSLLLGIPPIVTGIIILWMLRWRMNLLLLSEEEARAAGVRVWALRGVVILCATAITASCVSMCGQVGWVGLLVPHMCRMKFGQNQLALLPASVWGGAIFLVLIDTLARSLSSAEIPISILTAILGAPFFLFFMRRMEGGKSWN